MMGSAKLLYKGLAQMKEEREVISFSGIIKAHINKVSKNHGLRNKEGLGVDTPKIKQF